MAKILVKVVGQSKWSRGEQFYSADGGHTWFSEDTLEGRALAASMRLVDHMRGRLR